MAVRIAGTLGVLALAATMAPAAKAMDEGWYFEVGMGESTFSSVSAADLALKPGELFSGFNLNVLAVDPVLKRRDRSYAVITGYRFNRNLAMETGYFRAGAFQYSANVTLAIPPASSLPATFDYTFRAKGVMLGVAATWPLGEVLELRGRTGITSSDTRVRRSATIQATNYDDQTSSSSQDLYVGLGVGANVWKYYRVGIDWLLHMDMGKANSVYNTYNSDVSTIMLSLSYLY